MTVLLLLTVRVYQPFPLLHAFAITVHGFIPLLFCALICLLFCLLIGVALLAIGLQKRKIKE